MSTPNEWWFSLTNALVYLVFLSSYLTISNGNINQQVHRRFEYKYSFKPPYLAQKDGTVPFWEYGGCKYRAMLYIYITAEYYNYIFMLYIYNYITGRIL